MEDKSKPGILKWGLVALGIVVASLAVLIFHQVTTNNKPDTIKSIINEIHDSLRPDLHKPSNK